jgi:hypothetical protein
MSLRFYFMSLSAFGGPLAGEAISSYLPHRTYAEIASSLRSSQRHAWLRPFSMSLRFYFMSLRVLPQKDAEIATLRSQ